MERPTLTCPRDATMLSDDQMRGVHIDRCPTCRGIWLDPHELDELEAGRAPDEVRRGTIEFAQRPSELGCPVCGKSMRSFNYRAHNLELDICDEHGYWLDHGEERDILDVLDERRRGMSRIASAEATWHRTRQGGGGQGITERIRRFFGR